MVFFFSTKYESQQVFFFKLLVNDDIIIKNDPLYTVILESWKDVERPSQ